MFKRCKYLILTLVLINSLEVYDRILSAESICIDMLPFRQLLLTLFGFNIFLREICQQIIAVYYCVPRLTFSAYSVVTANIRCNYCAEFRLAAKETMVEIVLPILTASLYYRIFELCHAFVLNIRYRDQSHSLGVLLQIRLCPVLHRSFRGSAVIRGAFASCQRLQTAGGHFIGRLDGISADAHRRKNSSCNHRKGCCCRDPTETLSDHRSPGGICFLHCYVHSVSFLSLLRQDCLFSCPERFCSFEYLLVEREIGGILSADISKYFSVQNNHSPSFFPSRAFSRAKALFSQRPPRCRGSRLCPRRAYSRSSTYTRRCGISASAPSPPPTAPAEPGCCIPPRREWRRYPPPSACGTMSFCLRCVRC